MTAPAFIVNPSSRALHGGDGEDEVSRLRGLCPVDLVGVFCDPDPCKAAREALDQGADTLITLGGDGTAQAAAQAIHDADGETRLVPLPMGTANLLPRRLYATRSSDDILSALCELTPDTLPGGVTGGDVFLIAAAAGFPTTFARARETARDPDRKHRLKTALRRASLGFSQMFSSRLRYAADGEQGETLSKASGLMLWVEDGAECFEFTAVNVHNLGELPGLALSALNAELRTDDQLLVREASEVRLDSRHAISCMLDGEPRTCGHTVTFKFHPALIPVLRWPAETG
ncbi:diacylglycerol/lipid kinase family protein [Maricaulaceae bacterium MS644]